MMESPSQASGGSWRVLRFALALVLMVGALAPLSVIAQDGGVDIATEPSEPLIAPPEGKTDLIVAQSADVTTLDPQKSTQVNDITVSFNLYDNLLFRDRSLQIQPALAEEYSQVDDTTWEFQLRQDVVFHNGDPFTAEDVKFTIDRTYSGEDGLTVASVFALVEEVTVLDEYTVQIVTSAPDPLLPARIAFYGGQMLPMNYFEEVGPDGFNQAPVGTGPVQFVEWVPGERLVLERFDDYWGGPINFEQVIFRPIPENATRIAALQTGEVDIITKVPSDLVDDIQAMENARVESVLYSGLYTLAVNKTVAPLDNPMVMQALSLGIDRQLIIDELWNGQGEIPSQPAIPGDFAFDPDLPEYEYDPDRARELLDEAGYNGEEVIIETTDGYLANDRIMSEAIAAMWEDIGVNVRVDVIEASVRAEKNREKAFLGMWWSDPTSVLADPDGMMFRLLGPGGAQEYWVDEEWVELGREARTSTDPELREANYSRMFEIFNENFPWLVVLQPFESYGVANYVDWYPYANQTFDLRADTLSLADA